LRGRHLKTISILVKKAEAILSICFGKKVTIPAALID